MGCPASAQGMSARHRTHRTRTTTCTAAHAPPHTLMVRLLSQELADRYARKNFPKNFDAWKLNDSQRKVITTILTRKLTLVQGPPGTGTAIFRAALQSN